MAIISEKEIRKELNKGLKFINNAINMAKKNLIVGEVNYPAGKPEKIRKPRAKKFEIPGASLPDLDKKGLYE